VLGLFSAVFVAYTGDEHAFITVRTQPMKMAAMESLYQGQTPTGLIALGIVNPNKLPGDEQDPFLFKVEVPGMLSLLAHRQFGGFVPGIDDLLRGNEREGIVSVDSMMQRGKIAVAGLDLYKKAKKAGDVPAAAAALTDFEANRDYLGYGHLEKVEDAVPPVALTFYAFRLMVGLGMSFIGLFLLYLWYLGKETLEQKTWLLKLGVLAVFGGYVAQQCGWIVTEVGRQPWIVYEVMRVEEAVTGASGIPVGYAALALIYVGVAAIVLFLLRRLAGQPVTIEADPRTPSPDRARTAAGGE
jgi:cytochrome bd ubiquinol oxidase subunit I